MWLSSCFRNKCFPFALFQYAGYLTVWVIQIAKVHALCGTNFHTGWFHSLYDAVLTKGAFVNISIWMRKPGIVGA